MTYKIKSREGRVIYVSEESTLQAAVQEAAIYGVNLSGADLIGLKVDGADLQEAMLSLANLTGSELLNTNLDGADLRGTIFKGATLQNVTVIGAIFRKEDIELNKDVFADVDMSQILIGN